MSIEGFFIVLLAIFDVGLLLWKLHTDSEHGKEISKISREHTAALNRIGQAVEALTPQEAQTTANEVDVTWRRSDERMAIANVGAGPISLIDVTVQEDPSVLVEPKLPPSPLQLRPGKSHQILTAPSLATPRFLTAIVTWSDDSGIHQTEHQVSLS